jgi:hypothetical protein
MKGVASKWVKGLLVVWLSISAFPAAAADSAHTYAFVAADHKALAEKAESLATKTPDATTSSQIAAFLKSINDDKTLKPSQPARWTGGSKGNVVGVYVIYYDGEPAPSVGWTEEVRDSLFVSGLKTVVQLAGKVSGAADADKKLVMSKEAHILKEQRATVTVDVPTEKGRSPSTLTNSLPDYVIVVDLATDQEPKKHAAQEFVLLTGPREAFFWTADLPVNRVKQLKLSDKGVIESKDATPSFYVGIDYTFGDAASTPTRLIDALTIKGMVQATKQPLDSVGIALALRAGYFQKTTLGKFGLDLSAFSPFAGVTSTREDKEATGGSVTKTGRKTDFRVGIGFDIGSALKWLKKPTADKASTPSEPGTGAPTAAGPAADNAVIPPPPPQD